MYAFDDNIYCTVCVLALSGTMGTKVIQLDNVADSGIAYIMAL